MVRPEHEVDLSVLYFSFEVSFLSREVYGLLSADLEDLGTLSYFLYFA